LAHAGQSIGVEPRRSEIVAEVNHRILNALAMVQSLARHSFAPGGDPFAQQGAFQERLRALCAVHRLLGRNGWVFANLSCALEIALAPHSSERWRLVGPTVALDPGAAIDLTMVFDELASNAAKHGALSAGDGRVEVEWASDGQYADLTWREFSGPRRPDLSRGGFGLRLVKRVLTEQLGGSMRLHSTPDGLVLQMAFLTRRDNVR
jgi:two-component sensor histidine kinase